MRVKKLLGVVLLCLSTSAWAGFDEGLAAFRKNDYATALKEWQPLAEQGNVVAQRYLAVMYDNGLGVDENNEEGIKWYRKAAEQGDAAAQTSLGIIYDNGLGVPEDNDEAIKWYRKAAEQGVAQAIGKLGWFTAMGLGTEKNLIEGIRLLKLAKSKGDVGAENVLPRVQKILACLENSSTVIFGESLNCTTKADLRHALKNGGLRATRENDGYWYDIYDSSAVLEGTSELSVAYIKGKFAKAYYQFNSSMNTGKVVEVRNMAASKYGQPTSSFGTPSVGEVHYTWKLKDGITVEVSRGWPDTTVYLSYAHPANFAAMEAEQKRQKEAERYDKQGKAF